MIILIKEFLVRLFNNTRHGITNLLRYRKLIWHLRPWDTLDVFRTIKFQLSELLTKTWSERTTKEQDDILRCIELLNHKINDDFIVRCGGVDPKPLLLSGYNDGIMYIKDARTDKQITHDLELTTKAQGLEKQEWDEFTYLMCTFK